MLALGKIVLAGGILALGMFIAGAQHFTHSIRADAAAAPAQIQAMDKSGNLAVVVATGGAGRIEAGFRLMLDHGASRMLISGAGDGVSKNDILRILGDAKPRNSAALAERLDCCVDLGHEAVNTKGNASETIAWVQANAVDSIILVTADFHMPRTVIEFRRLMPELRVQPFPVPTRGISADGRGKTQWWQSRQRILTVAREYGKYLASLIG